MQYNFTAKWQMHKEYVGTRHTDTRTHTSDIKKTTTVKTLSSAKSRTNKVKRARLISCVYSVNLKSVSQNLS